MDSFILLKWLYLIVREENCYYILPQSHYLHLLYLRERGGERDWRRDWVGWGWLRKDCLWRARETEARTQEGPAPLLHTPLPAQLPQLSQGRNISGSKISEWKPFVKSCVGNEMPAHGRQWLWRNQGIYTHLAFLWFASLISSPGHRGVSPRAHRSGFCIIHIPPSFYFICFFQADFPLFLNIWGFFF